VYAITHTTGYYAITHDEFSSHFSPSSLLTTSVTSVEACLCARLLARWPWWRDVCCDDGHQRDLSGEPIIGNLIPFIFFQYTLYKVVCTRKSSCRIKLIVVQTALRYVPKVFLAFVLLNGRVALNVLESGWGERHARTWAKLIFEMSCRQSSHHPSPSTIGTSHLSVTVSSSEVGLLRRKRRQEWMVATENDERARPRQRQ
jgi:hypothetical protein